MLAKTNALIDRARQAMLIAAAGVTPCVSWYRSAHVLCNRLSRRERAAPQPLDERIDARLKDQCPPADPDRFQVTRGEQLVELGLADVQFAKRSIDPSGGLVG